MTRLLTAAFAMTALVMLGASATGCGDSEGPLGGSGGEPPGGGGGGGGEPTCQDKGGQCLAVPDGFLGPIEIHDDGIATCTNAAFQGGYEEQELTFEPAECGCACSTGADCTFEGATAYDNGSCSSGKAFFQGFDLPADGSCTGTPEFKGIDRESVLAVATPSTETCTSDDAPANLSPLNFEPPVDGCNVTLDACDAGVICFPDSVKTYCVYSDTETSCPSSFPVERRVIRDEDITDTRDCTCTCGDGTVDCTADITLFTDDACANELNQISKGDCYAGDDGQDIVSVIATVTPADTCGDTATQNVVGDVTVTGAGVLVCCLEE